MKNFKLFEEEINLKKELEDHLKLRGLDIDKTRVMIDDKNGVVYFFIYNLSGKCVGYQRYNPKGIKISKSNHQPEDIIVKYYTYISKVNNKIETAVYGLETYDWKAKYLFITEGIFDIIKVHNAGYCGIAMMMNNPPSYYISWLNTLPQIKIVIADNDVPGKVLGKAGNYMFHPPEPYKDLGEMPQPEADKFLKELINKIK